MSDRGPLRVAVLGAGGTIAPAIVRDLAESDEVDGLLLLDLDEARAEHVASLHGGTKARAAFADARASADDPSSWLAPWRAATSSSTRPATGSTLQLFHTREQALAAADPA